MKKIRALFSAIALLLGASIAYADTLDVQIGTTINRYTGVAIDVQTQNIVGLMHFGSTGYTQSTTGNTPGGVGSWTLRIDGDYVEDCQLVHSRVSAQSAAEYAFVCAATDKQRR